MAFPTEDMELTRLLVVRDPARSKQWYEDVLGAEIFRAYDTSIVIKLLGSWILLVTEGEPTEDKPTVSMVPPADADRVSTEFIFRVPDCMAAYDELRGRGAQFLAPPLDRGPEIRAFFRDPDGHLFEISELTER